MTGEAQLAKTAPLVSVCVLNYNGAGLVQRCLRSIFATRYPRFELLVVDNASTDGSAVEIEAALAEAPEGLSTRFCRLPSNGGYAAGHNAATRLARGEYFGFLNSSCVVEPEWLDLVSWMERRPEVGFAQPMIAYHDAPDRIQSLGSRMSKGGYLDVLGDGLRFNRDGPTLRFYHEVFSVHGSAFVARSVSFEQVGRFDERSFLYFEESDLCWRGWLRGIQSACYYDSTRASRVFHFAHATAPPRLEMNRLFDRNRTLSMIRNLSAPNLPYVLFNSIVVTSELFRHPRALARYWWDVILALPTSFRDRRKLQAARTVPDARIFGIPVPDHVVALQAASGAGASTRTVERRGVHQEPAGRT